MAEQNNIPYQTDANSMVTISTEHLIRKGSLLDRLLSKENLGRLGRIIVRETAYDMFTRFHAYNLPRLKMYGELFAGEKYPNTEGWRIFREAYANFVGQIAEQQTRQSDYDAQLKEILDLKVA